MPTVFIVYINFKILTFCLDFKISAAIFKYYLVGNKKATNPVSSIILWGNPPV